MSTKYPRAVLISDIHYNIHTLELADEALRQAILLSNKLEVPVIVAGDLHDTKANLRGEVVNALLETFKLAKVRPYVLVGNHDKINEKSEEHSLNFLQNHVNLVGRFRYPKSHTSIFFATLAGYFSDVEALRAHLRGMSKGSTIIMHQGMVGSASGDYIQDNTAITKEDVSGLRVISGHYHKRQTIELPENGQWDYIGNPYTLGYGEAADPEKGFQVLYSDGSLEFVPTNLRKHIIITADLETGENTWSSGPAYASPGRTDLIWVKATGTKESIGKFDKISWTKEYGIPHNIKLDLIPLDTKSDPYESALGPMSHQEILDGLIMNLSNISDAKKIELKSLWREL